MPRPHIDRPRSGPPARLCPSCCAVRIARGICHACRALEAAPPDPAYPPPLDAVPAGADWSSL